MTGWHVGAVGMGTGQNAKVPGIPSVYPFYNSMYGVVTYTIVTTPYLQLYKVVASNSQPSGYGIELVGSPITQPADIGSTVPRCVLDNHLVFQQDATADAAGKPFDYSAFTIAILTRSGETISFNYTNQLKTLSTDSFFSVTDNLYMVRVASDSFGRGYGLSLGDGSVFGTGRLGSVVEGIVLAEDGQPFVVSTTNLTDATFVSLYDEQGLLAVLQHYDPLTGRFTGVKDRSGSLDNRVWGYSYDWTLYGGAPGATTAANTAVSETVDVTPWTSLRPAINGQFIENTGYGITQVGSSTQGVYALAYVGGDDVPILDGEAFGLDSYFPLLTSSRPDYSVRGDSSGGTILAPPHFDAYLMLKQARQASNTQFTLQYSMTTQDGLSFAVTGSGDTVITTANYGWQRADLKTAARHTSAVAVVGVEAFNPNATSRGYYLVAFGT